MAVKLNYSKFPLSSLVKSAKYFSNYKDFENWYSLDGNHGYYWHITDNKNFRVSDATGPRDMSSMARGTISGMGDLMVTGWLEYWDAYYNMNDETDELDVRRNWCVLFDPSDIHPKYLTQVGRGFGNEIYLHKSEAKLLKIVGVYDRRKALQVDKKLGRMLPGSNESLFDLWEYAHGNVTVENLRAVVREELSRVNDDYVPTSFVEKIERAASLGYTHIAIGMISPKRRGVMLVKPDYSSVLGTYPLWAEKKIRNIITQYIDKQKREKYDKFKTGN